MYLVIFANKIFMLYLSNIKSFGMVLRPIRICSRFHSTIEYLHKTTPNQHFLSVVKNEIVGRIITNYFNLIINRILYKIMHKYDHLHLVCMLVSYQNKHTYSHIQFRYIFIICQDKLYSLYRNVLQISYVACIVKPTVLYSLFTITDE